MNDALWQAVLGEIELSVSRGSYVTWFKNTRLLRYKDGIVIVGVPNVFVKQQLDKKYKDLVLDTIRNNGVAPRDVEFKIHSSISIPKKDDDPIVVEGAKPVSAEKVDQPALNIYKQGLNERYTFETFIVGSGNELAYAACQAVATNPGTKYNPLFLYGGVGIGKTHLIQAVGNEVIRKKPSARVVYISSEQFVREFIEAVRYKKNTDFAKHYRSADVLIIDDIQFIAGKDKTQEEFFHTFNALHQSNKQIIISSDKPPKDITTLEERLRSRFAGGMTIDMQTPDFETRCAIVQTKAHSHQTELEPEVVEFLANLVPTNIRELEGALNQLLAFCEMRALTPDLNVAQGLLGAHRSRPKHISAKQIIERTAKHYKITLDDLLGPKRDKDIVVPRQVAMYMLRSELRLSFPKIARELGRKDHTTAIHSVEKIAREVNFDTDVRDAVSEIKERLYA